MSTTTLERQQTRALPADDHRGSWLPTWGLISTKFLEIRRRRGLMAAVFILTLGLPFLVLGFRLLFHAIDPASYGPAGSPSVFEALVDPFAEFGFIIAAAVGASAGTTDLTDGVFRHLVITGRSRVSLYLARIPAGLAILLPLVAIGYLSMCLVTAYEGTPQPTSVNEMGVNVPLHLSQSQFENEMVSHLGQVFGGSGGGGKGGVQEFIGPGGPGGPPSRSQEIQIIHSSVGQWYQAYLADEETALNPPINEMIKIGLWVELEIGIGFIVGLGLGSLTGQRTLTVILLIALQLIITPLFAAHVIPYFLNGQRVDIGIAMDQLRPAQLFSAGGVHTGPRHAILGGRGSLDIPLMPTWAMITVIVGWIVGWTGIGAWRMATRDA
jgi:hypothetical protein